MYNNIENPNSNKQVSSQVMESTEIDLDEIKISKLKSQKEDILNSNNFSSKKEILGGNIGDATFVSIEGDGNGVFKPHTKYNYDPERKMNFINSERAAYLFSQFLGFDIVPLTIVKNVEYRNTEDNDNDVITQIGSLQEFIENAEEGRECNIAEIPKLEILKLHIFDIIIANDDRHGANFLIKNNKIYAIDNGLALKKTDLLDINIESNRPLVNNDYLIKISQNDELPAEITNKIKELLKWENGVKILKQQIEELLGKEVAEISIERLKILSDCINEENKFDINNFKQSIRELKRKS